MTPDSKPRPTPPDAQPDTNPTTDIAGQRTTGAKVGEWVTKRVDKALDLAEKSVHAAHRLADVAEHAIEVTERVLHAAGHPAVSQPDKVVDADPQPASGLPGSGTKDTTR